MSNNSVDMFIRCSGIDISRIDEDELQKMRAFCAELIEDVTRVFVRKACEDMFGPFTEPANFTQKDFEALNHAVNPYPVRPVLNFPPTDKDSLMSSAWFPCNPKLIFNMDAI